MSAPTTLAAAPVAAAPRAGSRLAGRAADLRGRLRWGLLGVATVLLAWEGLARSGIVANRRYVPPLADIGAALVGTLGSAGTWSALGATATGWLLGFGIAVTGGIVLGLLLGLHPVVRALTASTVDFLRPVPSVAFIPVVVLLFGTGTASKVTLAVYAAIWPVILQMIFGIRDADPVALDTARSLRLGRLARLRHVTWPASLPYLCTGVRLSASIALVLCLATELIIGNRGLGREIALAKDGAALAEMYALIVVAGLLGIAVNALLAVGQRLLLRHHPPDLAGRTR